jgi:hypothetical protein
MRRLLLTAMIVAVVISFSARAQGRPDFSGTWTRDAAKSDPAPQGGGGSSGHTVKQTATEIAVTIVGRSGPETSIYRLDATEKHQPGPEPRRTTHGQRHSEVGGRQPRHRNDARNPGDDHHDQGGSHA